MAIITPFADPDAHGSIANSVSFRRRRGKVVFQKKPHGKQPNTPAQQAQKTRFSDGWKAYHQLSSWEIAYLTQKAIELNTTKANLFLSQFLTDEIPSVIPLNQIKEILNISLTQPQADNPEDILFEFISQLDAPETFNLLGHIFDNENITVVGSIDEGYTRSFITIENKSGAELIIPFNYPLVLDYNTQADVAKTQLIRLPEITLNQFGPASDTKWTDLKEITGLSIVTPQQANVEDIKIDINTIVSATVLNLIVGTISDNRNDDNNQPVTQPYTDVYIEFSDNQGVPLDTLEGMVINIDWIDSLDQVHSDQIEFPLVENNDGGAPSAVGSNQVEAVSAMKIKYTQSPAPTGIGATLVAAGTGGDTGIQFGGVSDNNNTFVQVGNATDYTVLGLLVSNTLGTELTLNEGYQVLITYQDQAGDTHTVTVALPEQVIPAMDDKLFFLSTDFSVYDEVGLTTLLMKAYINKKRFYVADDLSLYNDQALTDLAFSHVPSTIDIFLASDFSTYFDVGLTQLGNTPFY